MWLNFSFEFITGNLHGNCLLSIRWCWYSWRKNSMDKRNDQQKWLMFLIRHYKESDCLIFSAELMTWFDESGPLVKLFVLKLRKETVKIGNDDSIKLGNQLLYIKAIRGWVANIWVKEPTYHVSNVAGSTANHCPIHGDFLCNWSPHDKLQQHLYSMHGFAIR